LVRLGVTEKLIADFASARFELIRDPFDGGESLKAVWPDARGYPRGFILFYPDGGFYAEHDVVRAHPSQAQWFIEAMTAWGRAGKIKAEARLLPRPS
jgi:hypothetical protein